jgi:hypothetical protein
MENIPMVNKQYLLKKFPGKGGWTYAEIPEIPMDKHGHFGWVRVCGNVDGFQIKQYHLAPMGNGNLFFPVKSEIRKKIRKHAGDTVTICLYRDESPLEIPIELSESLALEAGASDAFSKLPESEKKQIIDSVNKAKTDQTKAKKIVDAIRKLMLKY